MFSHPQALGEDIGEMDVVMIAGWGTRFMVRYFFK
jgi:hypothetical protein